MYKNFPIPNLPKEEDDLILETEANNEHWSAVLKINKWATLEDVFNYLFDVGVTKFLSEKRKKYLHELLERWNPKHLQLDDDFDDYLDNGGLENIIGDKSIQNLNMDD